MGNAFCCTRSAKVMKISGETFKTKIPGRAGPLLRDHPGHVLLESDAVRHHGVRAKPLEPHHELKPSRLYFLVQLPKLPEGRRAPRRVRSVGVPMSAQDRLERLMLSRRSASDLSSVRMASIEENVGGDGGGGGGGVRIRMRLPRAEVERLVSESQGAAEVEEKIVGLLAAVGGAAERDGRTVYDGGDGRRGPKVRQKRVGFSSIREVEIPVAVAPTNPQ